MSDLRQNFDTHSAPEFKDEHLIDIIKNQLPRLSHENPEAFESFSNFIVDRGSSAAVLQDLLKLKLPESVLLKTAKDGNLEVRLATAKHPNATKEVFKALLEDESKIIHGIWEVIRGNPLALKVIDEMKENRIRQQSKFLAGFGLQVPTP